MTINNHILEARRGMARHGMARQGKARELPFSKKGNHIRGVAWRGMARQGKARQWSYPSQKREIIFKSNERRLK